MLGSLFEVPKVKKEPTPAPKLTAFDFFLNSKKHKYTELDAAAREEKLKRHYDKLDPSMRQIFEELASNQ